MSKNNRGRFSSACDRHHLCYIGYQWARGYAKLLRNYHYCVVSIPKDTLHRLIHVKLHSVIPPSGLAAKNVYGRLVSMEKSGEISSNDTIEKRLRLLYDLFKNEDPDTALGFMRQYEIVMGYGHSRVHPP